MTKKENNLVLLSSDEEYCGGQSSSSKRRYRKTKSQPPLPRKSIRQAKKARVLGSRSCLQDSRNVDEFNLFCEDFDQVFSTFKVLEAFAEMNYGLINTDHIHWKSLLYTKRR